MEEEKIIHWIMVLIVAFILNDVFVGIIRTIFKKRKDEVDDFLKNRHF